MLLALGCLFRRGWGFVTLTLIVGTYPLGVVPAVGHIRKLTGSLAGKTAPITFFQNGVVSRIAVGPPFFPRNPGLVAFARLTEAVLRPRPITGTIATS